LHHLTVTRTWTRSHEIYIFLFNITLVLQINVHRIHHGLHCYLTYWSNPSAIISVRTNTNRQIRLQCHYHRPHHRHIIISIVAFPIIIIISSSSRSITINIASSKTSSRAPPSLPHSSSSSSSSLSSKPPQRFSFFLLCILTFKCKISCAQLHAVFKVVTNFVNNYSWPRRIFLQFSKDCYLRMFLGLHLSFQKAQTPASVYGMTPAADRTRATCYT